MDLFVVPTLAFRLLYGFIIVRLDRRELVWIAVTRNPTADWIARQLTEAFPWDSAPAYLIRDRDRAFGPVVCQRMRAMGIRDKPIAPRSPWQNGFAERLIGSIRRECLDHVIIGGEVHFRRVLETYARYYNEVRTHRSLGKDDPIAIYLFEKERNFIRWNGESESNRPARRGLRKNLIVDADHLAPGVEKRAARIAVIDRHKDR